MRRMAVKRRTTWAAVATVTALAMLTAAAMIVDGCACFVPGTSLQPCGTFTPRVTPIPHDPPAEPLTPADAPVTPPETETPPNWRADTTRDAARAWYRAAAAGSWIRAGQRVGADSAE